MNADGRNTSIQSMLPWQQLIPRVQQLHHYIVVLCPVLFSPLWLGVSKGRDQGNFLERHHTNGTFCGLSVRRPDLFSGNPVSCLSQGMGRVGTDSGDQARYTVLVVRRPDERLKAVLDLCERDRQCANTFGGSDTTHPGASSSQRLIRTTTEYLGEETTTKDRSHREMALLSTHDLCLGRQRHHHLHGRRRHDDRHLQLHTRLV